MWVCPNCGSKNRGKFCSKCACPKPVKESEKWVCPKCGKRNKDDFCTECATAKPTAPAPVSTMSWTCPKCETVSQSKFCPVCGEEKPAPKKAEAQAPKAKKSKAPIIIAVSAVAAVLLGWFFVKFVWFGEPLTLKEDESEVPEVEQVQSVEALEPQHKLSSESLEFISSLDEHIVIHVEGGEHDNIKKSIVDVVKAIAAASGGKIEYVLEKLSENENISHVVSGDAKAPTCIVVESEKRIKAIGLDQLFYTDATMSKVYVTAEEQVMNAIAQLTDEQAPEFAIISGHGEEDSSEFIRLVGASGYTLHEDMDLSRDIPEGVKNLVIFAPEEDYTDAEIDKLDKFLKIPGSNLFVFWRSDLINELSNLERYLQDDWGILISREIVFDFEYCISDKQPATVATMIATGEDNPATAEISANSGRVLYACHTHIIGRNWDVNMSRNGDRRILPIATTSPDSFACLYDGSPAAEVEHQEYQPSGGFTVAAVSEQTREEGNKVFIFGSEKIVTADTMELTGSYNATVMNCLFQYANPNKIFHIEPIVVD